MANIQRWINNHGAPRNQIDLEAPRPKSVYDHVSKDLLKQLESTIGTGGMYKLLLEIPRDEWDQAEQMVRDYLEPPKKEETEVAAPVSETKPNRTQEIVDPSLSHKNIITRVDFRDFPNEPGIQVKKYADGWNPNSNPVEVSTQREMTLEQMVTWLEQHDWTVYRWDVCPVLGLPAGARAFRGEPQSVRTKWQLKKLRDQYLAKAEEWFRTSESYSAPITTVNRIHAIDLAFEL